MPPCVEPIITFGSRPDEADAVTLEHDGSGQRFRVEHSELPPLSSDWFPAATLTAGKINVTIAADHLEIRAAAATLNSPLPPLALVLQAAEIGVKSPKLKGIEPSSARSKVEKTAEVVRAKE